MLVVGGSRWRSPQKLAFGSATWRRLAGELGADTGPAPPQDFRECSLDQGKGAVRDCLAHVQTGRPRVSEQGIKPPPPKYEPARLGRSIRVLVNYFLVDCRAQEALHYSTEVNQIFDDAQGGQQVIDFRLKAEETRPVIRQLADQQRWGHTWVYDGKHAIYSTEEICPREETATNVTISRGRRQRKYQVKMKLVAPVAIRSLFEFIQGRADRLPQEVLQVLDIALRHTQQMNPACTAHNANFFFQSQQRGNSLGGGAQVC
eukprot:evm.model.scf_1586.2 EVM.evm.TU.scf_1586.2   scf_1586:8706-11696(-)